MELWNWNLWQNWLRHYKILFPTEESATNNAEFQLTGYEEQSTPNGDDLYSPTFVRALILVDGINQAKLELDVDYGTDDEPVLVDIYFFVSPYSIELNFDDTKATATSFSQNLSKESEVLIGVGLKVVYSASTKSEDDIQTVSGHLQLKSIRFIAVIRAGDVVNANDINDIIDITIKIDGGNAGKVILVLDAVTNEYVPYVKYNDGTTESLESLFEDLALELGGILL